MKLEETKQILETISEWIESGVDSEWGQDDIQAALIEVERAIKDVEKLRFAFKKHLRSQGCGCCGNSRRNAQSYRTIKRILMYDPYEKNSEGKYIWEKN